MITVWCNDTAIEVAANMRLSDFLAQYYLSSVPYAVMRNGQLVPRSTLGTVSLLDEDQITCLVPMQGG